LRDPAGAIVQYIRERYEIDSPGYTMQTPERQAVTYFFSRHTCTYKKPIDILDLIHEVEPYELRVSRSTVKVT